MEFMEHQLVYKIKRDINLQMCEWILIFHVWWTLESIVNMYVLVISCMALSMHSWYVGHRNKDSIVYNV